MRTTYLATSVLAIASALSSFGASAVEIVAYQLSDLGFVSAAGSTRSFAIWDRSEGSIKGWSHIVTHPERFPLVKRENALYAVDEGSMVADADVAQGDVFRTILVRKMSNWGQQHANGVEPVFLDRPIAVEDLDAVTFWIKFHSAQSSVPDAASLQNHYGPFLSKEQIDGLDRGLACLGLSFVEAGYNDQSVETLNAVCYVTFDPNTDFDRWLQVTVPLTSFQFGYEQNYALRPIEREEAFGHSFVAFRINPETTGGIQARNYLNEKWDDSVPELYKEMSISLGGIEATLAE